MYPIAVAMTRTERNQRKVMKYGTQKSKWKRNRGGGDSDQGEDFTAFLFLSESK